MTCKTLIKAGCRAGFAGLLLLLAPAAPTAAAQLLPSVFGTLEARSGNLKPFPKWTGMLERHFVAPGRVAGGCEAATFNECHYRRWQALMQRMQGRPLAEQLEAVNRHVNEARYITDPINWGMKDYWATLGEFLRKDGDCEDYAIAKYLTLRRMGVDGAIMRIVVLQDLNLRIAHAVLAVEVDGEVKILDNQIKQVVDARTIRHYRPIFSINEQAWWLHKPAK